MEDLLKSTEVSEISFKLFMVAFTLGSIREVYNIVCPACNGIQQFHKITDRPSYIASSTTNCE